MLIVMHPGFTSSDNTCQEVFAFVVIPLQKGCRGLHTNHAVLLNRHPPCTQLVMLGELRHNGHSHICRSDTDIQSFRSNAPVFQNNGVSSTYPVAVALGKLQRCSSGIVVCPFINRFAHFLLAMQAFSYCCSIHLSAHHSFIVQTAKSTTILCMPICRLSMPYYWTVSTPSHVASSFGRTGTHQCTTLHTTIDQSAACRVHWTQALAVPYPLFQSTLPNECTTRMCVPLLFVWKGHGVHFTEYCQFQFPVTLWNALVISCILNTPWPSWAYSLSSDCHQLLVKFQWHCNRRCNGLLSPPHFV